MTHKFLTFGQLRRDPAMQSRVALDPEVVEDYRLAIQSGEKLPRVSVVFDGLYYYLVDGWHRAAAIEAAGLCEVEAESIPGTRREALLAALSANGKNGARRTSADKQKALGTMLSDPEWAAWSDQAIAKQLRVSQDTVSRRRRSLNESFSENGAPVAKERIFTTKHGTQATMKVDGINANRAKHKAPADIDSEPAHEPAAAPAPSYGGVESEPTPPVFTDRSLANPPTRLCEQVDDVTDAESIEPVTKPASIEPPAPPAVAPVDSPAFDATGMASLFEKIQALTIELAEARRINALQAIEISDLRSQNEAARAELHAERARETT